MIKSPDSKIYFKYHFTFRDDTSKTLTVVVEKSDLSIVKPQHKYFPDWAKLKSFKCPHCPLNEEEHQYCPLALNLQDIISEFGDKNSFDIVQVFVETPSRNYLKKTSLQQGVSSLLGILMVTSGCPVMGKLKPLLYFHLPFASIEETEVRALSLYLLAQYVKFIKGEKPDWEMEKLKQIYEDVRILNHHVSKKIVNLSERDASINSLIVLNNFAEFVTIILGEKTLEELEFFLKEFF
ncbi:MAG: hypothetical protein N3F03_03095 [Ignavibacteria bacterium]|nr:hypothetical protein [Ignavibacteria bacterium]